MGEGEAVLTRQNTTNIRLDLRYTPLPHAELTLHVVNSSYKVLEISLGGIQINCEPQVMPSPEKIELHWQSSERFEFDGQSISGATGIRLSGEDPDNRFRRRSVIVFTHTCRNTLVRLLPWLKERGLICEQCDEEVLERMPKESDIQEALRAALLDERSQSGWPEYIKRWIASNAPTIARMGRRAWPLALRTITDTLSHYYIKGDRFERDLGEMLDDIVRDNTNWRKHLVPLRPLRELETLLNSYKNMFKAKNVEWHQNLWSFLRQRATEDDIRSQCLIALDVSVVRGSSRRKFLKLVSTALPDMLARSFKRVYLAAIVGFDDLLPFEDEALPLRKHGIEVIPKIARTYPPDARSTVWLDFLEGLGRDVPDHPPTKFAFHFGATTDSVPLYWQRTDDWTPLFQSFMLQAPNHRPIPWARFFSAYSKTLAYLQKRASSGGTVLLRAPQGSGKTYLAAKLAERFLSSGYVFWYKCRFGAVEDLVDNLDVFLDSLGIGDKLSSSLYKPQDEAELATKLVSILRKLDRPAVLIFDSFENVDLSDTTSGGQPLTFLSFARQMISSLGAQDELAVSQPFLLITHSGDIFDKVATRKLVDQLELPEEHFLYCPIDGSDAFEDPIPLARKLIHAPSVFERHAYSIRTLSHAAPYKTWLLCYWANRAARNGHSADDESVLDSRFAASFGDLDALHRVITQRLTEPELCVLQAAAAWGVPWSIAEMTSSLGLLLEGAHKQVKGVLANLIHDRAPFISFLDQSSQIEQFKPFAVQWEGSIGDEDRFEMPSIAANFFRTCLESDTDKRSKIYGGIAEAMKDRLKQLAYAPGNEFADRALKSSLMTEIILCLCKAGKPGAAATLFVEAKFYEELRKLNSWDRILQLGKAILDEANGPETPAYPLELRCHAAVVYANALAAAFRLSEAEEICDRFISATAQHLYWRARLRLIKSKSLRYANKYDEALKEYRSIADEFRVVMSNGLNADAAVWLGRTLTAQVQCLMSLGRLTEADAVLACVEGITKQIIDVGERRKIEGIRRRHFGTICLLRGDLEKAGRVFNELYSDPIMADEMERIDRVRTIILYKQARVHVEMARPWIPTILRNAADGHAPTVNVQFPSDVVPAREKVLGWLTEAEKLLNLARQTLGRLQQGDRKWFPAIDLCVADSQLLRARLSAEGYAQTKTKELLNHIRHIVNLVEARLPNSGAGAPEGRTLDIQILLESINWQDQIENGTAHTSSGFFTALQWEYDASLKMKAEHECWDIPDSNPYKQSRKDYERMYNLWRMAESSHSSQTDHQRNSIRNSAARVYRNGTSRLYKHGMIESAHAMHRLALACFAESSVGLQELLEASICLFSDDEKSISYVLDRIAIQFFWHATKPSDSFFTIPTKVVCRLIGDYRLYWDVVCKLDQPVERAQVQAGRSSLLVGYAQKLAWWSAKWSTNAKWDELRRKANLSPTVGDEKVADLYRKTTNMATWLHNFMTSGSY